MITEISLCTLAMQQSRSLSSSLSKCAQPKAIKRATIIMYNVIKNKTLINNHKRHSIGLCPSQITFRIRTEELRSGLLDWHTAQQSSVALYLKILQESTAWGTAHH